MPAPTIAIDFGTTRTKVAYFDADQGKPVLIELGREVRAVLPSIFYIPQGDGPRQVGDDAQEMVDVDPEGIVIGLKREIHKPGAKHCGPGRAAVGRVELASDMFSYIRRRCGEEVFHAQVTACILTVPVAFEEQKRDCLRRAAELGGFKRISLIDEPVAAALAWLASRGRDNHKNVIVCDVGGGTTDLALLRLRRGEFEPVPDVLPDGFLLGGNDVDERIWKTMLQSQGIDDSRLNSRRDGFLVKLRQIKELFSRDARTNIPVVLGADRLTLPREAMGPCVRDFNTQIVERVRRFIERCQQADVDTTTIPLLLVGGASRTPGLKEELEQLDMPRVLTWNDADYATVLGAAEQRCLNASSIPPRAPPVDDDNQSEAERRSAAVEPFVVLPVANSLETTSLTPGNPPDRNPSQSIVARADLRKSAINVPVPRPTMATTHRSTAASLAIGCVLVILVVLFCATIAVINENYQGQEASVNTAPNTAIVAPKKSTARQLPQSEPVSKENFSDPLVRPSDEPPAASTESPTHSAPFQSSIEFANALDETRTAIAVIEPALTPAATQMTNDEKIAIGNRFYNAFARLGELLNSDDCRDIVIQNKMKLDEILNDVAESPAKQRILGTLAERWLRTTDRPNHGVCLVGVIKRIGRNKNLYELDLELASKSKTLLTTYTGSDPSELVSMGASVILLGVLVPDPKTNLVGFRGEQREVGYMIYAQVLTDGGHEEKAVSTARGTVANRAVRMPAVRDAEAFTVREVLLMKLVEEAGGDPGSIEDVKRVITNIIREEVDEALVVARNNMVYNPESAQADLKLLHENVKRAVDLDPDVRKQLLAKIDLTLQNANRRGAKKTAGL